MRKRASPAAPVARKDRRARFLEVAERRAQLAVKHLRALARCANPALYEYTESEAAQIRAAMLAELDRVLEAFTAEPASKQAELFKFEGAGNGSIDDQ